MNAAEIGDLLGFAALYDNRKAAEPDILAWLGAVRDLPYADAREAVAAHYAVSTERIMPGHVRAGVKAIRAERIARSMIPAPDPALCDDPAAYRQALQAATRQAGDGQGIPADGQAAITAGDGPRPVLKHPASLKQAIAAFRRALPRPAPRALAGTPEHAIEQAEQSRDRREHEGEPAA
jgi:hypothetical protein